ncbi:MAG: 3-deoxy-8-phosphooctulonate synthase [Waddliaceae bacterium]
MKQRKVAIKDFFIGEGQPLAVMSGPCVIESEEHCLRAAEALKKIFSNREIHFIFKSSYDKANRSSIKSFRGPGLEEGLRILEKVKKEFDLPIVTDVHSPEQATAVGDVVDILQIPAFLCRQTDLVVAAGKTGAVVSIKKGQFLSPWDMANVIEKVRSTGNDKIIAVDRGTLFGYNNLVSDFRAIPIMQGLGVPVCFDATHSVQLPGGLGDKSGGQREYIPVLAKAAIAVGADCLFMESHPNPDEAKSDAASVVDFKDLPSLLDELLRLYEAVHTES